MAANATAIWRVRPSGNNNNGGGFDTGIASFGTDFSQQNAAQVTQSGGTVSTATVTLTDTGASFTSALIGNGIRVAGTGITTTYTFVTAVPSSTTLTLQTSPGTTGTSVTYSIGGGWADFTNTNTTVNTIVPGNTVFILGSGTPNPSSYVFDYTVSSLVTVVSGTASGLINFANDPLTPGYKAAPDTTGGMPTIKCAIGGGAFYFQNMNVTGLWFVMNSGSVTSNIYASLIYACVIDQAGFNASGLFSNGVGMYVLGCEVYDSTLTVVGGGNAGIRCGGGSGVIISCNVHDTVATGITIINGSSYLGDTIVAKNNSSGVSVTGVASGQLPTTIKNCTIDGNTGDGILVDTGTQGATPTGLLVMNNIISNHTGVGKFGINFNAQSTALNNSLLSFADYNIYYNNTANYNNISAGAHDTALGVTPYVSSATENYTLA